MNCPSCDGEALVTWEDGTHGVVNWNMLRRAEIEEAR